MAKLAEYKFTDYDAWCSAKRKLDDNFGSSGGAWSNESYSNSYYIYIFDECKDPGLAGKICRANGGEVYSS
jgi:hypothetical protein